MQIEMLNVGFGDCFILTEGQENLLVDCGSRSFKNKNSNFSTFGEFVKDLNNRLGQSHDKYSAVITHFHKDHYDGIKKMYEINSAGRKLFDVLYVPFLGYSALLQAAVYLSLLFGSKTVVGFTALSILDHIVVTTKLSQQVKCLVAGEGIFVGGTNFNVIWPDKFKAREFIDERFEKNYDAFQEIEREMDRIDGLESLTHKIVSNMLEWYKCVAQRNGDKTEYFKLAEKQGQYLNDLKLLKNKNTETLLKIKKKLGGKLQRNFSKIAHKICIVFHDSAHKVLMLGDIDANIISTELKYKFYGSYDVIKAPHHGTDSHYSKAIPLVNKKILISIGGHTKDSSISEEYSLHGYKSAKRVCTCGDDNCRLHNTVKQCRYAKCHSDSDVTIL